MSNEFYNHSSYPTQGSVASSASMRAELDAVAAGFDKLPPLTGNGGKTLKVNASGTGIEAVTVTAGIPVTNNVLKGDGVGGALAGAPRTDYMVPATTVPRDSATGAASIPTGTTA